MPIFLTHVILKKDSGIERLTTEEKINSRLKDITTPQSTSDSNTDEKKTETIDIDDENICCICEENRINSMLECLV